jgi:hypothetical protein
MTAYIAQLLQDDEVLATLGTLGYEEGARAEMLLNAVDDFLKGYVAASQVNGTEPLNIDDNEEALADIATTWLDEEGNGKQFWPCLEVGDNSGRLRYDEQDHEE